jgi:hypothetical protein
MSLDRKEMDCGTFFVDICFNPIVCFWLVFSVPLLGRARAKLYIAFADAGSLVHWEWTPSEKSAKRWYYYLLTFWLVTVLSMAFTLVFRPAVTVKSYFGIWKLSKGYEVDKDTRERFSCMNFQGMNQQCFSMVGGDMLEAQYEHEALRFLKLFLSTRFLDGNALRQLR